MSLVFEDPPKPVTAWEQRLAPLMEYPGRWVNLTETYGVVPGRDTVTKLRGRKVNVPPGEWSFTATGVASSEPAQLFARYDGPRR